MGHFTNFEVRRAHNGSEMKKTVAGDVYLYE
jgi:hypothetical protein